MCVCSGKHRLYFLGDGMESWMNQQKARTTWNQELDKLRQLNREERTTEEVKRQRGKWKVKRLPVGIRTNIFFITTGDSRRGRFFNNLISYLFVSYRLTCVYDWTRLLSISSNMQILFATKASIQSTCRFIVYLKLLKSYTHTNFLSHAHTRDTNRLDFISMANKSCERVRNSTDKCISSTWFTTRIIWGPT